MVPFRRSGRQLSNGQRSGRMIVCLCVAVAMWASAFCYGNEPERPNIVLILADDLGWTDLGCFGSQFYETPHIDALCGRGMKFTSAYSNGPNCAPTRACLMSGGYSPRHGVYTVGSSKRGREQFRAMTPVENRTDLASDFVTPSEALAAAGYATAHMGKWHLGSAPVGGPQQQGFAVNIGGNRSGHPPSYFSPYRNKQLKNGPKGEYLTDRLTDEAVRFIETNRDRPFFLYLAHYAVHTPLQAKPKPTKKYRDKQSVGGHSNATYAAMIESLDDSVGRVVEAIERLGLGEKTILLFASDNGGLGGYRDEGLGSRDVTSNKPLRGGKGMLYEGGIRVPMIAHVPGITRAGSVRKQPVITLDLYPTLLSMASVPLPQDQSIDGLSLLPLLADSDSNEWPQRPLYWHFPAYLEGGRGKWRTTPAAAIRIGEWKLIEFFETQRRELYHLSDDISERKNLAAEMPEKTSELYEQMVAWRKQVNAPMPTAKK